jgi:hypothetical protein
MAKSKKKNQWLIDPILKLEAPQSNSLYIAPNNGTYKDCEWCFQFDDNDPYVFAATKPFYKGDDAKIAFTLTNQTNTNIVFKDSKTGKEFKLFTREKI